MHRPFANTLALLVLAAATFTGCKKDDDKDGSKSKTDLLSQKTWKFDVLGEDLNDNDILDANENGIEDCQKDDTFQFKADHTGIRAENAVVCVSSDDDGPFVWKFESGEQKLIIDLEDTFAIKTLDESTLEIHGGGNIIKFKH